MKKAFEKTIAIPSDIQSEISNNFVKFQFQGKEISKKFVTNEIEIKKENSSIKVSAKTKKKKSVAVVNAIISQISNLLHGLKTDFEYKLEVVYSHFPMNIVVKEGFVEISNLAGAKMPKKAKIVGKTQVKVLGRDILVASSNKEHAGQTAANLENATKLKGKDKRIFQDGIYIVSKPKAAVASHG